MNFDNSQIISFKDTYNLLLEEDSRIAITSDDPTRVNKFKTRPQGILLQDTYNNPFFPIQPKPRLDTSKFELPEVYRRMRELYLKKDPLFLPWHFMIELVGNDYYIFNTRPINMNFPIDSNRAKENSDNFNDQTKSFFEDNIYDISEAIHVCILGDTDRDVYRKIFYEILARTCFLPIITYFRFPKALYQRIFPLNIGKRLNFNLISKFIMT